jgi:DNA-binding HxlR family transcriptional regulator
MADPTPEPSAELIADVFARDCGSRGVLADIAGKWGILALVALSEGGYRFNALRRRVDGVSEKMLSQTLQTLERDGLVVREVHQAIPPHVEYQLTPLGAEVATRLLGLLELLEAHVPDFAAAQDRYDAGRETAAAAS